MRHSQLNRALKLIKRTGDKLVIFDKETDAAFAVMDLDQYENLLDEVDFNPSEFDDEENYDDDFYAPSGSGFEPVGSVLKDRWGGHGLDESAEKSAPWDDDWKNEEWGGNDKTKIKFQKSNNDSDRVIETADTAMPASDNIAEEISLDDVPHEEEEETFLLEPVE